MQDINFFNAQNMALFWEYAKSLLSTAAPGVMIWFALTGVGLLLPIIVNAFRESNKDDDDDDFDYKHY